MSKKLLAAALAAAFLATGGVAKALDAPMQNVADNATGDAATDKGAGSGTTNTILIGANSTVTSGANGAGYTVDATYTLRAGNNRKLTVSSGGAGAATLTVTGALDVQSGGSVIFDGGAAGTAVLAGGGSITNAGLIQLGENAGANTYTGTFNNSSTYTAYTGTVPTTKGLIITSDNTMTNTNGTALLAKLATDGTGNIGDVVYNAALGGNLTATGATSGNLYFGGDADSNAIDAKNANLIITATATAGELDGGLSGGNVMLDLGGVDALNLESYGAITARGSSTTTGNDGTVYANKDNTELNGVIDAAMLTINGNAQITDNVTHDGGITVKAGKTVTNKNITDGAINLSGYASVINGTINNVGVDAASLTINSTGVLKDLTTIGTTSITGSGKIVNSFASVGGLGDLEGEILTDGAGLKLLENYIDLEGSKANGVASGLGVGDIYVDGDFADSLNWAAAKGGAIYIEDDANADGTIVGADGKTINVGAAALVFDDANGTELYGTITAGVFSVNADVTSYAATKGDIEILGGESATIMPGASHDASDALVDLGTGATLVNGGTLTTDKTTDFVFTDPATDKIVNFYEDPATNRITDGTFILSGENTDLADVAAALGGNQDGNGDNNVGTVNIVDQLTAANLTLAADVGTVTIVNTQNQTIANAKNIDIGTADLEFLADGNTFRGTVDAGDITLTGSNGNYYGTFNATGDYDVNGSGNTIHNTVTATEGDVNVTGSNNVFKNTVTAIEDANGDFGNINISGNTNDFYGAVTADQNVNVLGTENYFEDLVSTTSATGVINIKGNKNEFAGGIFSQTVTTLGNGVGAMFGGTVTSIDAKSGSTFAVGDNPLLIADGETVNVEDGSTLLFAGDGQIGTAGPLNDGVITLTDGTSLKVDRELRTKDKPLFDENLTDNTLFNGDTIFEADGVTVKQEFLEYLSTEAFVSLAGTGTYEVENGQFIYKYGAVDRETGLRDVMRNHGLEGYEGMVSGDSLTSQLSMLDAFASTADLDRLNDMDRYIAEVVLSAAGDKDFINLRNRHNEAYAIEQWKSGSDWSGSVEAVVDTVRNFNKAITSRAYNIGHMLNDVEYDECGNVISSCGGFKNRIWAGYTGQWDRMKNRKWDKGYDYDAHGFNIGYDHVTSSGVAFGAAFGYSSGDYENRAQLFGGKSDIDNYNFGLFASYNHASGFFTTISGTYTYSEYKMRNGFANYTSSTGVGGGYDRAKYHGDTWSVGGKIGYDIQPVANLTITPTIGLYYYDSSTNRFNSTYRNGMKYSRHDLEMPVELTAKYDIAVGCESTLSLVGTAGYAYNFSNKGTRIRGFTMGSDALQDYTFGNHRGTKTGHSSWNVGAGIQYRYRNVDFGVNYEYYGRKDLNSHSLNANVGYSF